LESIHDWLFERPRNPPGISSLISFLIFSGLSLISAYFLATNNYWWWLFGILVATDVLGMLASIHTVVATDRAIFFLVVVITEIAENPSNIFLLTLIILGLIGMLDFSFFLMKVDGTSVDRGPIIRRLKSYSYTVLPAFLLTYLLLFVYSRGLGFGLVEASVVLGLASVGALFVVYIAVRFMLSIYRRA
jgi:hypothetical protein